MKDQHDSFGEMFSMWLKHSWGLLFAWLGTVTLAQIQAVVGIASGLAVLVYTVLNTIKVRRELRDMGKRP